MSEELENKPLDEAKATGEDSYAADPVTPAGGAVKKRKGDVKKSVDTKADEIEDTVKTPMGSNDIGMEESAFDTIFDGEELSEEFKSKTVAVFEAAVHEKVSTIREELEEEFENNLVEQVALATEEIVEKVDSYLDYVVEQWMEANEMAVESALKVEVAESLLSSLKDLVVEHNMEISEEENDRFAELESRLEESEDNYNKLANRLITMKEEREELRRTLAFRDVSEGLTATQADKLSMLSEGISYDGVEEYTNKLNAIKESYFAESTNASYETEFLEEEVDQLDEGNEYIDPAVSRYVDVISRYAKK